MKVMGIIFSVAIFAGSVFGQYQQWVARYNCGRDLAASIAVDGAGNVYVTGTSYRDTTGEDYATIKYNPTGVQEWVARYNSSGNGLDEASSIAVDGSGNVYVTGTTYLNGTDFGSNYATVKYNSSGYQQWAALYYGQPYSWNWVHAIAVDGSGNVYVTGVGVGSGYATVKYNSAGAQLWAAIYHSPGESNDVAHSIAVDGFGNVYVTGGGSDSGTGCDYATVKYNSSGIEQWAARYNGPGDTTDIAYSLAVDKFGNVYVTGESFGSGTDYDYATVKYNSSGIEQWAARYNGPGDSTDIAYSMAVDGQGNVYVTGTSAGAGTGCDYATIKYNSSGIEQWAARYNGPGNDYDAAVSVAVDGSGNVYVTGGSTGSGTGSDYATVKYNSSGIEQLVDRYNGTGNGYDAANSLVVDGSGNVYVTGASVGSGTDDDYATIKYSSPDVGVVSIDEPSGSVKQGKVVKPKATVRNYGSGAATFTVQYTIDIGNYSSTKSVTNLARDTTQEVLFDDYYAVIPGSPEMVVFTQLPGDTNSKNDTMMKKLYVTGVEERRPLPLTFKLDAARPNPVAAFTDISYALPFDGPVSLGVYDITGLLVKTLVSGPETAGFKAIRWNGTDNAGRRLPAGVYFIRLTAGTRTKTEPVILVR